MNLKEASHEIRKRALTSIYQAQAGHLGPSLSWADIAATLFFEEMNLEGKDKDTFVLSKGHAVPSLYAALSLKGYIEENELKTLRQIGSRLQGHPVADYLPTIKISTGSLGQGLSFSWGYAAGNKIQNKKGRVYVVLGDGECQEGQVWEAAMSAPNFSNKGRISGLTAIIDHNKYQGDGSIKDTLSDLEPLAEKWKSFGWYVQEVDGHNYNQLLGAYQNAKEETQKPPMIIAHTIKGKGVSFMEKDPIKWHGAVLNEELYKKAMEELK